MSTEFENLVQNIQLIDSEYRDFLIAQSSEARNQRKLRACISLIHSEFEAYFELIGLKVIDAYQSNRMSKKQKGKFTFSISLYNLKNYEGQSEDINMRIASSISLFRNGLAQNNGIKEKDILKILLPLGFPFSSIDSTWLTSINSFGSLRGELVHKNINQITRLIGYQYIDETVHRILIPGTRRIDQYICHTFPII